MPLETLWALASAPLHMTFHRQLTRYQTRPGCQQPSLVAVEDCPLVPAVKPASTTQRSQAVILLLTAQVSAQLWMALCAAALRESNVQIPHVKSALTIQTTIVIRIMVALIALVFVCTQTVARRHRPNTPPAAVSGDAVVLAVINSALMIQGDVQQAKVTAAVSLPTV